MKISACLITRNAAAHLDACLASLDFCDEIVVQDQQSTDDTRVICERHGARLVEGPWLGFGPTKAAVVARARYDWVLSIDADEVVGHELRAAILALDEPAVAAFRVNRLSRFLGRWIRHCGWHPDRIVRLFDRRRAGFDDRPVHESVVVEGPTADLDGLLHHHTYDTMEQFLRKQDDYSTLGAEHAAARGRRASLPGAVLRAKFAFFRTFVLKLGFLDGWHGLVLSLGLAYGTLAKYVKIWQAGRRPPTGA